MAKMASSLNNNLVIPNSLYFPPTSKKFKTNIFAYLFLHLYLDNLAYEILNFRLTKKHLKSIFIWGKPQGGDHNNYIIGWCAMCTFVFEPTTYQNTTWNVKFVQVGIKISDDHWYNLFFTTERKKKNHYLKKNHTSTHLCLVLFWLHAMLWRIPDKSTPLNLF